MSKIIKNNLLFTNGIKLDVNIFFGGNCRVDFAWNFTHQESYWFLYCFHTPGACLEFDDQILRPQSGETVLIPPGTRFKSSCEKPFEHLYLHFHVGRPCSMIKPGVMVFDSSFHERWNFISDGKKLSASIYALLYSALAAIPSERFVNEEENPDDRIQRAIALLTQNVSNDEICRAIGMSGSNFQKLFKEKIGIPPRHYALKMRLKKACYLLGNGPDNINIIATECGFADRYAFSKAFKKYIGTSPAKYKASMKKSLQ